MPRGRRAGGPRVLVIVQNMPGAGSLAAARHVYSLAPKDGTAMGVVLFAVIAVLTMSLNGVMNRRRVDA